MADEHKDEHGGGEEHGGGHGGGGHKKGGGHGAGGGEHEEHEGAPEWLISFADNVALMMGFFVILLAMNMQKPATGGVGGEGKFPSDEPSDAMNDFAIEIRKAFHTPVDPNSTNPREQVLVKRVRELQSRESGKTPQSGVDGKQNSIQAPRPSDWVHLYAEAQFVDFDAALGEEGKASMAQAALLLKGQRWIIEVRGHVSAVEAKDNKERAMRLGYDRALGAAAALVESGVRWDQLRVVACADNERDTPRASTAEAHRSNQRVEVVTTQEEMAKDAFNGPSSAAGTRAASQPLATPLKE